MHLLWVIDTNFCTHFSLFNFKSRIKQRNSGTFNSFWHTSMDYLFIKYYTFNQFGVMYRSTSFLLDFYIVQVYLQGLTLISLLSYLSCCIDNYLTQYRTVIRNEL